MALRVMNRASPVGGADQAATWAGRRSMSTLGRGRRRPTRLAPVSGCLAGAAFSPRWRGRLSTFAAAGDNPKARGRLPPLLRLALQPSGYGHDAVVFLALKAPRRG